MLVFSRNSQYGTRRETPTPALNNNDNKAAVQETAANTSASGAAAANTTTTSITSFFSRAADRQRTGRSSIKKCRPHSWHSTIQKGLARARSRSLGRDRDKDRAKRASSALTTGKRRGVKISDMDSYSLNPDPAKNLNPDPELKDLESGSKLFLNTILKKLKLLHIYRYQYNIFSSKEVN